MKLDGEWYIFGENIVPTGAIVLTGLFYDRPLLFSTVLNSFIGVSGFV